MTINGAIAEVCKANIDNRLTARELVDIIRIEFPELILDEAERLVTGSLQQRVRNYLANLSDNGQDSLPGLRLPAAIRVRNGSGEGYYVSAARATWRELLAGQGERESNIKRVKSSYDQYALTLDRLRPYMENHPDRTVAEALAIEIEHSGAA